MPRLFGQPTASFCGTSRAKNWFHLHKPATDVEKQECKAGLNWLYYPEQPSGARLTVRKRFNEPLQLDTEPERDADATDSETESEEEGDSDAESVDVL